MAQEEPVTVKQLNKERIRAYMGKHESASRSQIARELGLSFPTVGRLIDELCSDGELTEQGAGSSTGGRCACLYELNPLFSLYLLVQVESDRVCWNLKDLRENTVEQGCLPFEILSLEQLDALILDIHHRYPRLKAAAAGIAALVNHGVVEETNQYIGLKGLNLEEHFRRLVPIPMTVGNDMNFLTMGCWAQKHPDAGSLVTLFMGGNGIGGGMVINGRLWTGASGYCSEVGFLPVYERLNKGSLGLPPAEHISELYARLIQIYAVTVNPHMMVLYRHPLLEGRLDEIRRLCASYLPSKAIPSIELSYDYQQDYEKGLFTVAKSMGQAVSEGGL